MNPVPLWLALRLPQLAEQVQSPLETQPAVWVHKHRVTHANTGARQLGVKRGQNVATATALGARQSHARDFAAEACALGQLTEHLYHCTPYIQRREHLFEPGLQLELSRCLKLFSGAENLIRTVAMRVQATGFICVYGVAHTAEAAWLLAKTSSQECTPSEVAARLVKTPHSSQAFLEQLQTVPLTDIDGFPEEVAGLNKSGFFTFGDIATQVARDGISSLKKRFGAALAHYLCDLFAIDNHLHQPSLFQTAAPMFQPESHFDEQLQFDYPVTLVEQLYPAMRLLLEQLGTYLRQHQLQCHDIIWRLADIHNKSEDITVHSDRAQQGTELLYELSRIRFEHHPLGFEVDTLGLRCLRTEAFANRDQRLNFAGAVEHNLQAISITAAKLKAHLGDKAVFKVSLRDDHVPEQSVTCIPLGERACQKLAPAQQHLLRPKWLFSTPKPIQLRAQGLYWQGYLTLVNGPERIQTQWWDAPIARDYFIALRSDALRLWVYQDLHAQQWYVQGVFG